MCSFVSLGAILQKLPLNKSPGPDCISAEHLLYADESLRFFLSELFNMCIPVLTSGGQYVNSVDQYKYLGIVLDTELSDDKDIQRQLRYQYCGANKLRASFSRCSNAVKNVLFRSFCTPMYASRLWCNFRKSCMQRLRVAYNFGCRALYNLPWRASVSSHQVQCNIPTFEALLRKYKYLFLERCRKSNNLWLRALMQSDCLYSSLFFEHYNRILLCD